MHNYRFFYSYHYNLLEINRMDPTQLKHQKEKAKRLPNTIAYIQTLKLYI